MSHRQEVGCYYESLIINISYDISPSEFNKLVKFTISFGEYDKFWMMYHPKTNEFFLGDMNNGGHGARCRIIKVERAEILTNPSHMNKWYENRGWEIWK